MKHQILSIITAMLLSACSLVNEPGHNCTPDDSVEEITLTFKMTSSSPATRADDRHDEEESEYRELEDGIDYSDLGLFIFARMESKPESDEKLVMKNTNILSTSNTNIYIDGAPGAYNVSITILRTILHDILFGKDSEKKIDPDSNDKVVFRILLLANSSSPGTNAQGKWNQITGTTYKEVINQLNEWHYAMAYLYNENYTGDEISGIYNNRKKNIPMFGTNVFTVTQSALYYSRPEDQVFLGDMDMLRALAKVRVVDNINNKDAAGFPKISKVEFYSSQTEARQLPENAVNYKNGNQVHTPNIYEPDKELKVEGAVVYRLGIMPESMTTVPQDQRKGSVYAGFVPEQKIGDVVSNFDLTGMPQFSITIALTPTETKQFNVPMTRYGDEKFDFGENILRNHIYTLQVNSVEASKPLIEVSVKQWKKINYTYEY